MDCYVNQDILSYLDVDTRIITKRSCVLWYNIIESIGIKETKCLYDSWRKKAQLIWSGCCDASSRKINNSITNCVSKDKWIFGFLGACYGGNIDLVKIAMREREVPINIGLMQACFSGQLDMVKFLVEQGAYDLNGGLHCACLCWHEKHLQQHYDIIQYMIENGARNFNDINSRNNVRYFEFIE